MQDPPEHITSGGNIGGNLGGLAINAKITADIKNKQLSQNL